jgi:potassium efflux system protein
MHLLRRAWNSALVAMVAVMATSATASPMAQKLLGGSGAKPETAAPVVFDPAQRRAQLEKLLAAALTAAEQERTGTYPVPSGATPAQVEELRWLLGRFPLLYQAQLDLLREIDAARETRLAAEEAQKTWNGPRQPGPYTMSQFDSALDQLDGERARLRSYMSVGDLQSDELQRAEARLKAAQADERLQREKSTSDAPAPLELARLRTRRAGEAVQLLRMQGDLNEELLRTAKARIDVLSRESETIAANHRFTEEELDRILKGLQAHQAALDSQIEDREGIRLRATRDREQARKALAALPSTTKADDAHISSELQVRLDAGARILEALRTELSALTTLRGLLPLTVEAWKKRYAAFNNPDPDVRQAAAKQLGASFLRMDTLQTFADDLGTLSDAALHEQQARVEALDEGAVGRSFELAALEAARRASDAVSEVQAFAQRMATARLRWKKEYEQASGHRPLSARLAEAWAGAKEIARSVWDFELFAVEDTVELDGKRVALSRGITVGKSIGALMLFVIGYQLMGLFARRAQRLMVERFKVDIGQARLLRRWLMLLTGFVLFVITLNLAHIPLTVFAFAGGALAIGVGFGTQTLLRNLISGVIMLFERKVRVGDIVDVEGVLGTVTAVDIRSTTVRQFDGIETMVPNSLLLENKVTNWTGENPTMRRTLKVGVAYGSPTREAADIMKATAEEHGLVLKEPAPFVIFEDFGDNALMFALYFWVDLAKASGMQVTSDLRFMLEKRFTDAGITVAYPQRDVHLDAARPLRVEVVGGSPPAAS